VLGRPAEAADKNFLAKIICRQLTICFLADIVRAVDVFRIGKERSCKVGERVTLPINRRRLHLSIRRAV
jgi:hypothetical protein